MDDDTCWECMGCGKILLMEELATDDSAGELVPACPECGACSLEYVSD